MKAYRELRENDDPIFTESCMLPFLWHDLILPENQVPWMVLENLFKLTKDSNRDMPLIVLATIFLENNLLHKATRDN